MGIFCVDSVAIANNSPWAVVVGPGLAGMTLVLVQSKQSIHVSFGAS